MTQRNFEPETHNELGTALRNGRVLALILVFLAIVFVIGYAQRAATLAEVQEQLRHMEAKVEAAHFRTAELQAELRFTSSEEFLDKIAREELGLVKPGEIALILVEPPTPILAEDVNLTGTNAAAGAHDNPQPTVLRAASTADAPLQAGRSDISLSPPEPSFWQAWLDLFSRPLRP
jgi:cell division protein FtsB